MKHYRCDVCSRGFDVEPLADEELPACVHCVFCGGYYAQTINGMEAAAMIMTPAKIVARENHGRRMRQTWRGVREAM